MFGDSQQGKPLLLMCIKIVVKYNTRNIGLLRGFCERRGGRKEQACSRSLTPKKYPCFNIKHKIFKLYAIITIIIMLRQAVSRRPFLQALEQPIKYYLNDDQNIFGVLIKKRELLSSFTTSSLNVRFIILLLFSPTDNYSYFFAH